MLSTCYVTAVEEVNIKSTDDGVNIYLLKTIVMEYTVDSEKIMAVVEEEVSRVASRSYSDDGSALYDGIRTISRDKDTLYRMLSDMFVVIMSRFRLFLSEMSENAIAFALPDLPDYLEERIVSCLNRFIAMGIVAKWLEEKGITESGIYQERSTTAINEAELLMMTRKPIAREGI